MIAVIIKNKMEEQINIASQYWRPTNALQWVRVPLIINGDSLMFTNELQQKWISDRGEEEWRTVPFAAEEK